MWPSMTDPEMDRTMNPDRFAQLTWMFGGDTERWPAAEREAARGLAAARPALTEPLIEEARRLDRTLDGAPLARPSRELRDRIVQAAPRPRTTWAAPRWLAGLGLTAGLASAAVAGVAAGLSVAPATLAPPHIAPAADPGEEAAMLLREPSDLGEG
jgi:hypothetical protein